MVSCFYNYLSIKHCRERASTQLVDPLLMGPLPRRLRICKYFIRLVYVYYKPSGYTLFLCSEYEWLMKNCQKFTTPRFCNKWVDELLLGPIPGLHIWYLGFFRGSCCFFQNNCHAFADRFLRPYLCLKYVNICNCTHPLKLIIVYNWCTYCFLVFCIFTEIL